jgi:hypothetical protein
VIGMPPRTLTSDARGSKAREAGVVALLLAAAASLNPDRPLPFEVCGFQWLTGLPCPTCGLTRALCHALHGHWARSLSYHPAGLLVAAVLVGWVVWSAIEACEGRLVGEALRVGIGRPLLGVGAALSLGFWIVRISALTIR